MFLNKKPVLLLVIFAMLLAACAPAAAGSDTMMEDKPTEVMMEEKDDSMMAEKTATADSMMAQDKMMADATATSEAMMKEDKMMADATATSEAMMKEDKMMADATATSEAMMKEDKMMADATATSEAMMKDDMAGSDSSESMSGDDSMMDMPAYFSTSLTDVATGQSFSINDLKGKVILVENMAQWCPTCLKQQGQVIDLYQLLGERDDFVTLGLDIDPNEDAVSLKSYIASNGFFWTYAVAPAEVSNEIANLYGDQFLNPPSTPMFIIDRHGEVHLLPFGLKSAQDLQTALQPFLDEGM